MVNLAQQRLQTKKPLQSSPPPYPSVPCPVALGQGYNSINGAGLSTAVVFEPKHVVVNNSTTAISYTMCTTQQETASALGLSGSISASGWGQSVDAKMSYYQSLNTTEYSVVVVVNSVVSKMSSLTGYSLPKDRVPKPTRKTTTGFFEQYGDSFLTQATTGAQYIATWVYHCDSQDSQSQMVATLNASGVSPEGELSASLQSSLNTATQSAEVSSQVSIQIYGVPDLSGPSSGQEIQFGIDFPSMSGVSDGNSILSYSTTGYEVFPQLIRFDAIAANRDYFVGSQFCDGLAASLAAIQSAIYSMQQLQFIYNYYSYFGPQSQSELDTLSANLQMAQTDVTAIFDQMNDYCSDPFTDFAPLTLYAMSNGSPSLQCSITCFQPGARSSSVPNFSDIPSTGPNGIKSGVFQCIYNMTSIATVQLHGGGDVNGISTTYTAVYGPMATATTYNNGEWQGEGSNPILNLYQDDLPSAPAFLSAAQLNLNAETIRFMTLTCDSQTIVSGSNDDNDDDGIWYWSNLNTDPNDPNKLDFYVVGFSGTANEPYLFNLQFWGFAFLPAIWTPLAV